jgi:hypothetical protein
MCNGSGIERAFSPLLLLAIFSWGVAPDWYGTGPLALQNAYKKRQRREIYQPGATPQENVRKENKG